MNIVGLNIKGSSVRAAFIQRRFGLTTKHLGEASLDLPAGREERRAILTGALEEWSREYGIKGVVVGLDLSRFSHHIVQVPVTAKEDIAGALSFELERHLPLAPEEFVYDFHTLKASRGDEGTETLVLALRKDRINWLTTAVTETGLKFLALRCSDIEALNEFIKSESPRNALFITQTDSRFFAAGIGESGPSVLKTIRSGPDTAREIGILADTFNRGIFASGVTDPEPLANISIRELNYSIPSLLATSSFRKRQVSMNFLPVGMQHKPMDYQTFAITALSACAIFLFFLTSILSYYKDYSNLKHVNERISEIKSTSSHLVEMKRETESLNEKLRFLHAFQVQRNKHIEIIKQVSITLPKDAWLTNYYADDEGNVELEGYAKRSAFIIAPFEKHDMFQNVEFTSPVTVRGGKERFSIKMEVLQ